MAICTLTVDAGLLGVTVLTVSYKYCAPRGAGTIAESATIYWIKVGGTHGTEVEIADDDIAAVIIPACVADWHSVAILEAA